MTSSSSLDALRERAHDCTRRAHTPFSDEPTAAVLLLDDGTWIPGVRVESASFSLRISSIVPCPVRSFSMTEPSVTPSGKKS